MIVIKLIKGNDIEDYRTFPTAIRGLSNAIYWLRDLRIESDPFLLLNKEPESWLEIDGVRIPDSVLFQLNKEQYCSYFLKSFLVKYPPVLQEITYKK